MLKVRLLKFAIMFCFSFIYFTIIILGLSLNTYYVSMHIAIKDYPLINIVFL